MRSLLAFVSLGLLLAGCTTTRQDLVFVRGGSFDMGDAAGEGDDDERPVYPVQLDSYWIGKHELAVGQFREFIESTNYVTTAEEGGGASVFVGTKVEQRADANWRNPYFEQDDSHPVVCVSWFDAIEYCNWRSRNEGLEPCYVRRGADVSYSFEANGYCLPTEAEWEYAARSRGKESKYAWDDGQPRRNGRKAGNTRDEAAKREWGCENIWDDYDDGYACTAPVCAFAPSALGLHDLSGSVYEWCWDWYDEDYYDRSSEQNPRGPDNGEMHACRDCGFCCPIRQEILVTRGKGKPTLVFSWGGFRIARSAD